MTHTKQKKRKLIFLVLILLAPIAFFYAKKTFFSKDPRLLEIQKEVYGLREKKAFLEKAISDSEKREFVEKEARERLNMVYPGETVVVLPSDPSTSSGQEAQSKTTIKNLPVWERWVEEIF